jgi:hypothetical protein
MVSPPRSGSAVDYELLERSAVGHAEPEDILGDWHERMVWDTEPRRAVSLLQREVAARPSDRRMTRIRGQRSFSNTPLSKRHTTRQWNPHVHRRVVLRKGMSGRAYADRLNIRLNSRVSY